MALYLGIDIGGTKCAVCIAKCSQKIEIKGKKKFFTPASPEKTIKQIIKASKELFLEHKKPVSAGISCGGPLDSKNGIIMSPPNLPGWNDIQICGILNKELNIPVYLQNDANACALAEWKYGAGRGYKNIVFLTFGTGLGAGLILNGKLYEGANGMAGETGHIRLAEDGPFGYGKKGSFEGFCSGGGIAGLGRTKAREIIAAGEKVSYIEKENDIDTISAKSIADSAKKGNRDAIEIYKISGRYLGRGLAILVDILNPDIIVIGSIYARDAILLKEEMQKELNKEALYISRKVCRIVPSQLEESIGDIAAISTAVYRNKNE